MKGLVFLIILSIIANYWVDRQQAKTMLEQTEAIIALQKNKEMQNKVIMRLVNLNGGLR